jgi:hypothetical protein
VVPTLVPPDVEVPAIADKSTICLTGEEHVDPGVAAQASSPAVRKRHGGVPSPRHRVGPWVPVMPLKVGPSLAGGDTGTFDPFWDSYVHGTFTDIPQPTGDKP